MVDCNMTISQAINAYYGNVDPRTWNNVRLNEQYPTLIYIQDISRYNRGEFGVLKFVEYMGQARTNLNVESPFSNCYALAYISTLGGEEHISGFSDENGEFDCLKVVPPDVLKKIPEQILRSNKLIRLRQDYYR